MKNNNTQEISFQEMININGGSEFSDWTWRVLGAGLKHIVNGMSTWAEYNYNSREYIGGPTADHG